MTLLDRIGNRSKDYVLFNRWLDRYWVARARGKITALLYHQVDAPERHSFLVRGGSPIITQEAFRAELRFLQARGARFFTFDEIVEGRFPDRDEFGVAICFDDCFLNNYTLGLDALDELEVKATFFQSTAMVDASELLWEHRLYWYTRDDASSAAFGRVAEEVLREDPQVPSTSGRRLLEYLRDVVPIDACARVLAAADARIALPGEMEAIARRIYPSAEHLRRARSRGHAIGSHGHHHYKRTTITEQVFEAELAHSCARLEQILGEKPRCFSYPFDDHIATDAQVCRRYVSGAATVAKQVIERSTDPMWLPRFTWPGPSKNGFRLRRWLLTGTI